MIYLLTKMVINKMFCKDQKMKTFILRNDEHCNNL